MTSFGIEWEPNALIFLPDRRLPENIIEKQSAVIGTDWKGSITLEGWWIKHDKIAKTTNDDCLLNLEVNLGVFKSENENQFNLADFQNSCNNFKLFWNNIINTHQLIINQQPYEILSYILTKNENVLEQNQNNIFIDCARKNDGYLTNQNNDLYFAYTNNLNNIKGTPQLTFGIKLRYIINLFYTIYNILESNNYLKNDTYLNNISISYQKTQTQFIQLFNDKLWLGSVYTIKNKKIITKQQTEILNLVGFILLSNYFLITNTKIGKEYQKALFLFKIRSNLRCIYDLLEDNLKEKLKNEWKIILENNYINIIFPDEYINIENFWKGIFEDNNPFVKESATKDGIELLLNNISPVTLFRFQEQSYQNDPQIKKIKIYSYNTYNVPSVKYREKDMEFYISNTQEIINFDIGEWKTTDDIIYLELRSFSKIFKLLGQQKNVLINSINLCDIVSEIITNFFNEIIKVN
jgi:hypothetical protein